MDEEQKSQFEVKKFNKSLNKSKSYFKPKDKLTAPIVEALNIEDEIEAVPQSPGKKTTETTLSELDSTIPKSSKKKKKQED